MQCLNVKNPEVAALLKEYTDILGSENAAYFVLSENNGYGLDMAPDGEPSTLYQEALDRNNGDKKAAIMELLNEEYSVLTADTTPDVYPYGDNYHFELAKDYRNGVKVAILKNKEIKGRYGSFSVKDKETGAELIKYLKDKLGSSANPYYYTRETSKGIKHFVYLKMPIMQTQSEFLKNPVTTLSNLKDYQVKLDNPTPHSLKYFLGSVFTYSPRLTTVVDAIKASLPDGFDLRIDYVDTPLNELYPNSPNVNPNTPALFDGKRIVVNMNGDMSQYGGLGNVLLHEALHVITLNAVENDPEIRKSIQRMYDYYQNKYGYVGSLKEFIADMFSRPEVIDNMLHDNGTVGKTNKSFPIVTLWQKLKEILNRIFGKSVSNNKVVAGSILDMIVDYNSRNQLNFKTMNNPFAAATAAEEKAAKEIAKNFDDLVKTIELRLKALQYSNVDLAFDKGEIHRTEKLSSNLRNIKNTIKDSEIINNIVAYIDGANNYVKTILSGLDEARFVINQIGSKLENQVITSNPEKLQTLRTALDTFYADYLSPHRNNIRQLLKSLQTEYNANIYKNAIGVKEYDDFVYVLDNLNKQLSSEKMITEDNVGWLYSNIVKKTVTNFLRSEMEEANDPTMEAALENWLTFEGDVSSFNRRLGMTTSSDKVIIRILRKVVGDVHSATRKQVYDKFAQIKSALYKVSNPLDIFEKDADGKRTGYIVRDRKYGVYQKNKFEWRKKWLDDHGLASIDELKLNPELFVKYQKDYNKFKTKHAERRFTPDFYDIFANLSYETNLALSEVNKDIELILAPYIGKDGKPRFEEMPEDDFNRWEMAQSRKRNLANPYDPVTGELKPADSTEGKIARELQAAYTKLQQGLKSKANMDAFLKEMQEMSKVNGYTPDGKYTLYEAWLDRNTRWETTEEFNELASNQIKQDYGETYNKLYEARKNLLNLYRNSKYEVMYKSIPLAVKEKIKQLDIAMYKIRSKAPKLGLSHALYETELSSEVKKHGGVEKLTADDYFLDRKGRRIYYSYLNRVVPKNRKYFKRVPNRNWAETSSESAYYNHNFDRNSQEAEQPKFSIKEYDNRKEYNKLMSDPNFVEFRKVIVDTITEANDKLVYSVYKNSYKFPQVLGHIGNYIMRKGFFSGIKEYAFDAFSITPDDELHGVNNNTRPDGSELNIIPTMYTTMLNDPNLLTNDVVGAVMKYYKMACNYENKRKVAPQLNLLDNLVKSEGKINDGETTKSAESSELAKQVHEYIGYHLYGRRQMLPERTMFGHKFSLDKVFKAFATWGRDSGLAWNLRSAISGGISAWSFYAADSSISKHYNKSDFIQANAIVTKDMLTFKTLGQLGKNISNVKTLALLEYNGLSFNQEEDLSHVNRWRIGRAIQRLADPYALFQMASFLPNSVLTNAVYLNYKLVKMPDGNMRFLSEEDFNFHFSNLSEEERRSIYDNAEHTLLEAYDVVDGALKVKPEYKKYITPELEDEVTNKLNHIASHAEGMVEEADKSGIYFNTALSTILMFRAFLPKNIENTVGNFKPFWNYQTKELTFPTLAALAYGFKYGSSYKLVNLIHSLKTEQSKAKNQEELEALREKYKGVDVNKQIDKYIGRFNAQVMTYLFWSTLFYVFSAITDDDDDTYLLSLFKLELNKVALESGSRYNIMDITSIFNSITPLTGTVEDVYNVFWLPEYFNERKWKKIKRGAYKGYYGWQRDLIQLFPPVKALFNLRNPDEKLRDLKNRIQ